MATETLDTLTALLQARPASTRTRTNDADTMRVARIASVEDTSEPVNISDDEFYTRGDSKGQPMAAQDVRNTYVRKFEDRLKSSALVIHVISWNLDGEILPEDEHYALLAPVA